MENIAFATLLFCVYFVAACLFIYDPSKAMNRHQSIPVAPGQLDLLEETVTLQPTAPETEAPEAEQEPAAEDTSLSQKETVVDNEDTSNLPTIDVNAQVLRVIDNLGKREARKVMGGLKLQQKRNGVELSTELMIASIKREFKASPESVIEVMSDRLPELLPAAAQTEQLAC